MEKVYQFLTGLNDETFGTIRSQILSTEPLPSLTKACSIIAQEERQRILTMGQGEKIEASAFFAHKRGGSSGKANTGGRSNHGGRRPQCSHCRKVGREKKWCYELIGYPKHLQHRTGIGGRKLVVHLVLPPLLKSKTLKRLIMQRRSSMWQEQQQEIFHEGPLSIAMGRKAQVQFAKAYRYNGLL